MNLRLTTMTAAVALMFLRRSRATLVALERPGTLDRVRSETCTNTSLPPSSRTMNPKLLFRLNDFTVPASSHGPLDLVFRRRCVTGTAVLVSTLSTWTTCGPLSPRTTRTLRRAPGCTASIPLLASTFRWRKASPKPSDSSTNPNPLLGLNHLTTEEIGAWGAISDCDSRYCSSNPKAFGCRLKFAPSKRRYFRYWCKIIDAQSR
jgi:hypothetical protein